MKFPELPGWVPFWGKKSEAPQEPQHLGPVSAPPGSQEASQARTGQLTETLAGQQGQTQVGELYKTPPSPEELWQAQRGERITSERPAARNMTNDQLSEGLNAETGAAQTTAPPAPKPVEVAPAPLTPTAAPTREATPTTVPHIATPITEPMPTPTSAPMVEIPTPAAGPKPSPNTTSGTGEKAA